MAPEGWHAALAALAWQVDLGVAEVIGDAAIDRYDLPETSANPLPKIAPAVATAAPRPQPVAALPASGLQDAIDAARHAAARASTLTDLHSALAGFDQCELKKGARNLVFADGNPKARLLILSNAPTREEDIEGRPMVGAAGALLDAMFAAIGLSRSNPDPANALYITTVMPWRTPQDRDPEAAEIAMLRPFVERHIALADPDVIVLMGNAPLQAVLDNKGIQRARGTWATAYGKPVLPMIHPADLLRTPSAKREAWADLLGLKSKLG